MEMTYEQVRENLKSGDVVLFSGKGFVSMVVRWFTSLCNGFRYTKFSHVGMVATDSERILIFESTQLKGKKGVQLNAMSERIKEYGGQCWVRHLACDRGESYHSTLSNYIQEMLGRKYERNLIELMGATSHLVQKLSDHDDHLKTVFCSELVCGGMKRQKHLPKSKPANFYDPQDFELNGVIDKHLCEAERPAKLSDVIKVML